MKRAVFIASMTIVLGFFTSLANAALWDRGNGLIYDDVLNITWMQDASYYTTLKYGGLEGGSGGTGGLAENINWYAAKNWVDNLVYAGYSGWRLPRTLPLNGVEYTGVLYPDYKGQADAGWNISAPGTLYAGSTASEMAYMFHNNLGNNSFYDQWGYSRNVGDFGLVNSGPFINIMVGTPVQYFGYWSESYDGRNPGDPWVYYFGLGYQLSRNENELHYVWAVHDGDIGATTPIPTAFWLLGSGLLGLLGVRRKLQK